MALLLLLGPLGARASGDDFREAQSRFFAEEDARIRQHLLGAEREVRARDDAHLSPDQRRRRRAAMDALREYRAAGRFPRNRTFVQPTPFFVDAAGTRCAMAALIEDSGHPELVRAVASTRNEARVKDLATHPALVAWLEHHGLTVEEAARIQPHYEWCYARAQALCADYPVRTIARLERIVTGDDEDLTFRIREVLRGEAAVGSTVSARIRTADPTELDQALGLSLEGLGRWVVHGLRDGGRVFVAEDPCDVDVSLPLAEALEIMTADDCVDRLESADPLWAGGWCEHIDDEIECPGDAPDAGVPERPEPDGGTPVQALEMDAAPESCSAAGGSAGWGALLAVIVLGVRFRSRRR